MANILTTLGNGNGFIYSVDTDGTSIIQNLANNLNNVKKILLDASTSVGLSGNPGAFDSNYGKRYFLDAAGVAGVLSGVEITSFIVNRGLNSTIPVTSYTIAAGVLTPIRKAAITVVNVEGEGGASDQLDTIVTTDYNTGDLIIFQGATAAHIITFKDSTGNIELANAADFLTGDLSNKIILEYNSADTNWYEVSRTPNPTLSVANLRAAGIAEPVQGVDTTALVAGGGTLEIEPGVDKGVQVYTSAAALAITSGYTIQIDPDPTTPYLDGDSIFIEYRATIDVTTHTQAVTIFGITLTAEQALEGRVLFRATYKLSNTTWYYDVFYSVFGVDVENKAHTAATYEPILGNPAANGYILSSTTGGTRSWIPNTSVAIDTFKQTILAADFQKIFSAPITLLPALGANNYYNIIGKPVFKKAAGAVAYNFAGSDTGLYYDASTGAIASFLDTVYNTVSEFDHILPWNTINILTFLNKPVLLLNTGGDATLGDGNVTIQFDYRICNIS